MQWFYLRRLSASVSGGTVSRMVGPFYGDPLAIQPFTGLSDYIMVYANGAWVDFQGMPIVGE